MMKRIYLTEGCVVIAGVLFFLSLYTGNKWFILPGAFFDWLPLFTGWMRFGGKVDKVLLMIHVVLTLIAYALVILWVLLNISILSILFIEVWWLAVFSGVVMTVKSLKEA